MKKILKDKSGFAMAELLVVAVIVLILFSLLFSNYLPLVGEYENKISYNNVTGQYASFYLRRLYKNMLETDAKSFKHITDSIEKNGYYEVYSKDKTVDDNKYKKEIENIIYEYGIEEVIITKYDTKEVKEKYTREKLLYNYIDYLPKANEDNEYEELYRIILKTKDYGYATTAVLTDELTSGGCFDLVYETEGFAIKDYLTDKEGCSSDVIITDEEYTFNGKTSKIYKIMDNAFKDKDIISISLSSNIKEVGVSAFENNKIKSITINKDIVYKEKAFANNDISNITIEEGVKDISKSLFENDKKSNNNVKITISKSVTTISDYAFKNLGVSNIEFTENNIEEIGSEAFYGNNLTLFTFSSSIKKLGSNIFGDSTLGNKRNEIMVYYDESNKILDNDSYNFCNVLFGSSCTREEDGEAMGYKYTFNNSDKYITYVVGDINE